jgi:hypothetical protein
MGSWSFLELHVVEFIEIRVSLSIAVFHQTTAIPLQFVSVTARGYCSASAITVGAH